MLKKKNFKVLEKLIFPSINNQITKDLSNTLYPQF